MCQVLVSLKPFQSSVTFRFQGIQKCGTGLRWVTDTFKPKLTPIKLFPTFYKKGDILTNLFPQLLLIKPLQKYKMTPGEYSSITFNLTTKLEAVIKGCSIKKVFFEISQNSKENTCARDSFLIRCFPVKFSKEPATLIKKRL